MDKTLIFNSTIDDSLYDDRLSSDSIDEGETEADEKQSASSAVLARDKRSQT